MSAGCPHRRALLTPARVISPSRCRRRASAPTAPSWCRQPASAPGEHPRQGRAPDRLPRVVRPPGYAHKDPDLRNTRRTQGRDQALVCGAVFPNPLPCVRRGGARGTRPTGPGKRVRNATRRRHCQSASWDRPLRGPRIRAIRALPGGPARIRAPDGPATGGALVALPSGVLLFEYGEWNENSEKPRTGRSGAGRIRWLRSGRDARGRRRIGRRAHRRLLRPCLAGRVGPPPAAEAARAPCARWPRPRWGGAIIALRTGR